MKKLILVLLCSFLMTGCQATQTFETLGQVQHEMDVAPAMAEVYLSLPETADTAVFQEQGNTLYHCDGYTLTVQTFASGDMVATIKSLSGFSPERLTVLETAAGEHQRYDWVWTATGEGGDVLCRAAVLDDGNYHYVLTSSVEEDQALTHSEALQGIFRSFQLLPEGEQFSTGS